MLGGLLTLLFVAGLAIGFGSIVVRRRPDFDPLEAIGVGGLLGLLTVGVLTFFLGMLGLLSVPVAGVLFIASLVWGGVSARQWAFGKISGRDAGAIAAIGIVALLAWVSVITPTTEWDSLAYHLAVPKLWLEAGRINPVLAIHHSYFPFAADNLFIWGLAWGGEYGAKGFSLGFFLLGSLAIYGLARRWYGQDAGVWAGLIFAGCPVVAWESGTAYIDVAHGLFAGLGILYAVSEFLDESRGIPWLPVALLGGGLATKHTGLQILAAVAVVIVVAGFLRKKPAVGVRFGFSLVLAVLVALPWYARTSALQGNPVYPFFYSILGGNDWDQWRSEVYSNEQASFGVKQTVGLTKNPGHAVLGMGYQPGRYTNPMQTEGGGFPSGAVGATVIVVGLAAAALRVGGRRERLVLATVGVALLAWYLLSQQTRYLTVIAVPIALVGSDALSSIRKREFATVALAVVVVGQWLYTVGMVYKMETETRMLVVTGQASPVAYRNAFIPFAEDAEKLNQLPETSKIALYDEVFGFLLDRPYMWANPGHSKTIPYDPLSSGEEYADAMRGLGFTHIYLSLRLTPPEERQKFLATAGLAAGQPYSDQERTEMNANLDRKWRLLLADAIRENALGSISQGKGALIIEVPGTSTPQR
ncbi:MAG: glycosyltransferase family 39 protein [Fimbriimonadaceae bacterium]|nr:glycosyltransferase family 39 protein [Fimbriimonadaceae bacterium]